MIGEIANKASYAAATGATLVGLLTVQEWAAVIGVFLAMATFFFNAWIQLRRLRLFREHLARNVNEKQPPSDEGSNGA